MKVRNELLTVTCTLIILTILLGHGISLAQVPEFTWAEPQIISTSSGFSWFPDLAVDVFDAVHVVWCQSTLLETGVLEEQVLYTRYDAQEWASPNDIVPPSLDIVRNAIATDAMGNLHLIFGGSAYGRNLALYYQKAVGTEAWSATSWSEPHRLNQGISYMGDMAVDSQGVIHIIYDDTIQYRENASLARADIFYRRSADGGQTWSRPVNLDPSPLSGSARPYLEIDASDTLHVTWDEGWDRLSGIENDTFHSVYVSSGDGGQTWSSPVIIDYPNQATAQLTVGSDGQGGVLLVWRSQAENSIFYQWSTDKGQSWTIPAAIPQLYARSWSTPFDMYDMATDSAGSIHLVVVGRQSEEPNAKLGVYHLAWDGTHWSLPIQIFEHNRWLPEYPKITIHEGNQMHAAWFGRAGELWDDEADRQVWYSRGQSPAPHQPAIPDPTPTLVPSTATPTPTPTATPHPEFGVGEVNLPEGLYTDNDEVLQLAKVLSPLALLIIIIALVKTRGVNR